MRTFLNKEGGRLNTKLLIVKVLHRGNRPLLERRTCWSSSHMLPVCVCCIKSVLLINFETLLLFSVKTASCIVVIGAEIIYRI